MVLNPYYPYSPTCIPGITLGLESHRIGLDTPGKILGGRCIHVDI